MTPSAGLLAEPAGEAGRRTLAVCGLGAGAAQHDDRGKGARQKKSERPLSATPEATFRTLRDCPRPTAQSTISLPILLASVPNHMLCVRSSNIMWRIVPLTG